MRAYCVWVALLAVAPWACGSGGGANNMGGGGDAAEGGNADGQGGLEGSTDAADSGASAANVDAGVPDGAGSEAGDAAASCSGMPQSVKGSCILLVDPDAATSAVLDCIEYSGSDPDLLLTCTDLMGTSSAGPCPTVGLAGRCLQLCGTPDETVGYNYLVSKAAYQQSCEACGGIFLP